MPSDQTPNYALNQWEREDRVLMEDFNADNVKIDTALAAEAKARATADSTINATLSAHSAALSKLGNCQIYTTSYVGNGKYGQEHSNTLSFPRKPLLVIIGGVEYGVLIAMIQGCQSIFHLDSNDYVCIATWQGNSVSWYNTRNPLAQMNDEGKTYNVVAFFAMD